MSKTNEYHVGAVINSFYPGYEKDENFHDTPRRWLSYLAEYFQPYEAAADLGKSFPAPQGTTGDTLYRHGMVVQAGIPYRAVCAHHLLPVLGRAHVGYIPSDRVVGLSKLSRLVQGISHRRPSLQEDVCNEVVDMLTQFLHPVGAICVITAEHGCMAARGVSEPTRCVSTATSAVRGAFAEKPEAREEFFELVRLSS